LREAIEQTRDKNEIKKANYDRYFVKALHVCCGLISGDYTGQAVLERSDMGSLFLNPVQDVHFTGISQQRL